MDRILISIKDTGRMLGIGRTKVYDLIRQNRLETVKLGSRTLVHNDSIKAFVEELR